MSEELHSLVGKYGVLNEVFEKNTQKDDSYFKDHSYRLVNVVNITSDNNYSIMVQGDEVFGVNPNEIDILSDTDPIIQLKVGQEYEYQFMNAIIEHIDYRTRKMKLRFNDAEYSIVSIPNFDKEEVKVYKNVVVSYENIEVDKLNKDIENPDHLLHKKLINDMHETYLIKNKDYGNSFSEQYKKFGIQSALIRMDDKMRRIEQLMKNPANVKDEKMIDTVKDLANYAVMTWMELDKEEKANVN